MIEEIIKDYSKTYKYSIKENGEEIARGLLYV